MVIQKVEYSKKFISETGWEDISHHGSPIDKWFQKTSKQNIEFMENLIETFAIKSDINMHYCYSKNAEGFDGKQQYIFSFGADFPKENEKNPKENVEYNFLVQIKKAGALEKLTEICDLESFLLENGFKKTI